MLSFLRRLFRWEPAHDPKHVDETVNIPVMQNQRVRCPLRNGEYRERVVRRVYAVHCTSDSAVMGKTRIDDRDWYCRYDQGRRVWTTHAEIPRQGAPARGIEVTT